MMKFKILHNSILEKKIKIRIIDKRKEFLRLKIILN